MKTIKVSLKENSYNILIGQKILPRLGSVVKTFKIGDDAIIISNPNIARRYGKIVIRSFHQAGITSKLFLVPEGEQSKSAEVAFTLISAIATYAALKKPFIVALGGGVIGDLAGFVAAVYRRGIPYIQVPTSFLAQIDSAIGGKVGIDLPEGKNLVGAFYQPKLVYSDIDCLASLPVRQLRNGLAEAIKYGIIADKNLFAFIEKNHQLLLNGDRAKLLELVERCCRIKTNVVQADEKETKGIRSILNFGHTFGHAIEAASYYRTYQHGEAIALGMRMAADLSFKLKRLSLQEKKRIQDLISLVGLPQEMQDLKTAQILKAMRHDKKFSAGKNKFVLVNRIGKVQLVSGIPLGLIQDAIRSNSKS